ncbi:MAG: glycosyltransferase [Candidatus Aenigmarchaeota archaeon]|nr:glycosyltransferase [Candidatus Aenigmarchaeota archaeon]
MISIIIPAYNEEKRIKTVIDNYLKHYIKKYKNNFELIVVVDGTDDTLNICKKYASKFSQLKINYSKKPEGKGAAIIRGFKLAKNNTIGFVDADESICPFEFDKLIDADVDCAIASRKTKDSKIIKKQPIVRRFASKGFNVIVNTMFCLNLTDTQCGAKVFKKKVIDKILPQLKYTGFEFDVELLWQIKKNAFEIKEIPVKWEHQDNSSFSLKEVPKMFIGLVKVRLNYGL